MCTSVTPICTIPGKGWNTKNLSLHLVPQVHKLATKHRIKILISLYKLQLKSTIIKYPLEARTPKMLTKCCCCVDLKEGVKTLSVVMICLCGLTIISTVFRGFSPSELTGSISSLLLWLLITCGIEKNNRGCFLPWLVLSAFGILAYFGVAIYVFTVYGSLRYNSSDATQLLIIGIVLFLLGCLHCYFWAMVISLYLQMGQEQNNASTTRRRAAAAAKDDHKVESGELPPPYEAK